ncbi:MAG TPA: TetR/AcrR family transcriptional regulator [Dongiaceae bacterium]|nr:TetR/AcrR family transcriptional regulator [Dongiaceae bacterium]
MTSQNASKKNRSATSTGEEPASEGVISTGKTPQRRRGKERVAALLAAAVDIFAEKGFEAATMTEIAAKAGASIGSLYQFFPTKDVLAAALHEANGEALSQMLEELARETAGRNPVEVADRLFADLKSFITDHPAFVVLLDRRDPDHAAKEARRAKLRGQIARLLQQTTPPLAPARAEAMAVIILHVMKAAMTITSENDLVNGPAALDELRAMLKGHLEQAAKTR